VSELRNRFRDGRHENNSCGPCTGEHRQQNIRGCDPTGLERGFQAYFRLLLFVFSASHLPISCAAAAESPAKKAKVDEQGKSATVYRVRRGEEITFELKLNEAAHITPGSAASGGASSSDEAAAAQSSQKAESNGSARSKFAPLERPFVRVSDKASIKLLRKFIAEKLGVPVEEVDITCKNVVLPDNHTLEFIKKTQWTAGGLMVLGYQKRVRKL